MVIQNFVLESQYAVIQDRSIIDNVLAAYEIIHYMKWKKMENMGYLL